MPLATEQQYRLRDGRMLGYAEYGDPQGRPLLYFHGFPSSRLEATLAEPVAKALNIRLIAIDRPGFGLSDFKPGRTLADWPGDVGELADGLGLNRFAVVGVSGGGPYALACATLIPQRLSAVGIVCGLGPLAAEQRTRGVLWLGRLIRLLSRYTPRLTSRFCRMVARVMAHNPDRSVAIMIKMAREPDKTVLAQDRVKESILRAYREAVRSGPAGIAWELQLYSRAWNVRLEDITKEVHLWHGERDHVVPVSMGRHLAKTLPSCWARFYPEEGHVSLPVKHLQEILSTLMR